MHRTRTRTQTRTRTRKHTRTHLLEAHEVFTLHLIELCGDVFDGVFEARNHDVLERVDASAMIRAKRKKEKKNPNAAAAASALEFT